MSLVRSVRSKRYKTGSVVVLVIFLLYHLTILSKQLDYMYYIGVFFYLAYLYIHKKTFLDVFLHGLILIAVALLALLLNVVPVARILMDYVSILFFIGLILHYVRILK